MIDRRGFLAALLAHAIAARNLLAANASGQLRDWLAAHEKLSSLS